LCGTEGTCRFLYADNNDRLLSLYILFFEGDAGLPLHHPATQSRLAVVSAVRAEFLSIVLTPAKLNRELRTALDLGKVRMRIGSPAGHYRKCHGEFMSLYGGTPKGTADA
jgi:hypothetical protein